MKEKPILFNADMVRAILDGRKTQTRRIVKPQPFAGTAPDSSWIRPFQVGQRLWVRESWAWYPLDHDPTCVIYRADYPHGTPCPPEYERWLPCIHMPSWASRILLEVTAVRVQRLQDISDEDALAEGLKTLSKDGGRTFKTGSPDRDGLPDGDGWPWLAWEEDPRRAYKRLWESIYGPDSWAQNPWVWVIEFRRIEP